MEVEVAMMRTVLLVYLGLLIALPLSAQEPSLERTIEAHERGVRSVVFSPDGTTLASGGKVHAASLWNVGTGENIATVGDDTRFGCVAFNLNGKAMAAMWGADGKSIEIWEIATHTKIATIDKGGEPDFVVNSDSSITVRIHALEAAAFSPDGNVLVWGTTDQAITLRNVIASKNIAVWPNARSGSPLVFSPNGMRLASVLSGKIMLRDVANEKNELAIAVGAGALAMAFSPDGKTLAYSAEAPSLQDSYSGTEPQSADTNSAIALWDTTTGQLLSALSGHHLFTFSLAFSPDGETLASGGQDCTVRLWDVASKKALAVIKGFSGQPLALAFSPDGKVLASGDADGKIKLWDMSSLASAKLPSSDGKPMSDHTERQPATSSHQ